MDELILRGKYGAIETFTDITDVKFIGASKNGKKWQIEVYYDRKKIYLGCVSEKIIAAKCFDIC